jgi:hypothetical protein
VKDDYHHPSETYLEEQLHPAEEKTSGIDLHKEEAHTKIETDKTNL